MKSSCALALRKAHKAPKRCFSVKLEDITVTEHRRWPHQRKFLWLFFPIGGTECLFSRTKEGPPLQAVGRLELSLKKVRARLGQAFSLTIYPLAGLLGDGCHGG